MLAADAKLDIAAGLAAALCPHAHQRPDTLDINRNKRVNRIDFRIRIGMDEGTRIIAADAKRGLRQIIGAE